MSFSDYSKIQSEYATYSPRQEVDDQYKEAIDAVKPLRPPTAPAEDIQKVRTDILNPQQRPSVLYIQICLFIVFLCMLSYLLMPADYAHGFVFLLLCVALSIGIFLRK
jgi:hypothetical protein